MHETASDKILLESITAATCNDNCVIDFLRRESGLLLTKAVTVTGTGTVTANVLKLTGSVKVYDQWALITEVTTLTNMTDVYADLWDGTNSVKLTKTPGATLSNAPVGTYFTKDQIATETYTVNIANQCRMLETKTKQASPFIITQKESTNTYIRFCFTTTDAPINFKMSVYFVYNTVDGGTLEWV